MSVPIARSPRESVLYFDLHPCACGVSSRPMTGTMYQTEDGLVRLYQGTCPGCGVAREFAFGKPRWPVPDGQFGGDEPSQIIDAGEWLEVAHRYASSVPAELSHDPSNGREQRRTVETALAALDEVLKFIPPGADEVPDNAFWTERGRAYRVSQPLGTFRGIRLQAYRSGLASCL